MERGRGGAGHGRSGLEDTAWVVEHLGGVATTGREPRLVFGADGRLSGSTGVNRVLGQYEVEDGVIHLDALGSTRMAGPPESMEQERVLLAVLASQVPFVLDGDRLVLVPGTDSAPAGAELRRADETRAV
ncbi:MAG: META domain-containing protein [Terracoccus sp.]